MSYDGSFCVVLILYSYQIILINLIADNNSTWFCHLGIKQFSCLNNLYIYIVCVEIVLNKLQKCYMGFKYYFPICTCTLEIFMQYVWAQNIQNKMHLTWKTKPHFGTFCTRFPFIPNYQQYYKNIGIKYQVPIIYIFNGIHV